MGLKNILIIQTEGNTYNNPTLNAVLDLIKENSINVDIRYPSSIAPMPFLQGIMLLPISSNYRRIKTLIYDRISIWWLASLVLKIDRKFLFKKKYDLIIGVDRFGLIEGSILSKSYKIPLIFFSFEIMFEKETSKSFKSIEKKASKSVNKWFVQDLTRANALHKENELSLDKCFCLPLASEGKGEFKLNRLRDDIGVPLEKKAAILLGSLESWTMAEEILKAVSTWPDDWILIVHERYGRTLLCLEKMGFELNNEINSKLYFSEKATDKVDDMGFVLSGVTVGLAFYKPTYHSIYTGENLACLGLSSGKIATFLRYGIPVIANEIGLYAEKIRNFDFGVVEPNVSQIGEHLKNQSWNKKSNNAKNFYMSFLDFKLYKKDVWNIIQNASFEFGDK